MLSATVLSLVPKQSTNQHHYRTDSVRRDLLTALALLRSSGSLVSSLIRKALPLLCRFEDLKRTHERLVNTHHGTRIIELSAIVGGRKESHKLSPSKELVSILYNLVSTANQIQIVLVQELSNNILPKGERDTPVVLTPSVDFLIGVRPEEVTQEASIRYVCGPDDTLHLVEASEFRAETTVHAEDFFIDHCGTGEAVEAVREGLPKLDAEPALAFVVETVDTVDRGALVVSTEDKEVLGVFDLVCQEEADRLQRLFATINVVTQEDVVGLGREAAVLKQTEQVVVLSVHVAADFDGCLQFEEHGLSNEEVPAS